MSIFIRFDIILFWLLKPNTTLLLLSGLETGYKYRWSIRYRIKNIVDNECNY